MNPSQAIANSVGKTLLAQVFNNSQLVNLDEISDSLRVKEISGVTINAINVGSIDLNDDQTAIFSTDDIIYTDNEGSNKLTITSVVFGTLTRLLVTGDLTNWTISSSIFLDDANENTNASGKLLGDSRPTFDSSLQSNTAGGLYSKDRTNNIFPRANAEQIARTIDVIEGRLNNKYEFDTNITFETTTIDNESFSLIRQVFYTQLLEVPFIAYLIDIDFNNGTTLNISTYDKDLKIPNGYYGESNYDESVTTTYTSTPDIVKIDALKQPADVTVGDGIPGAGLTFTAETPGLLNAIQTEKHINGKITLRIIFIREGKILAGPVRGGLLKIDGANHIANPRTGINLITLSTIKTWESINQPHGVRTSEAYLKSIFENDGFFKNSRNANISKTFKED